MSKKNKIKYTEVLLLVLVWLVLLAAPMLFRDESTFDWMDFLNSLEVLFPVFIIFLINRFILVPKLLFRKKRFYYLFSVAALIAIFTLGSVIYTGRHINRNPQSEMPGQFRPHPPPGGPGANILPPGGPGANIQAPGELERQGPMPPFANLLIFSILLVGFDTGLMISFRLSETEKAKARLEKENVGTQLAFLRNQVNPHFFMNTLNNIHSLIDFDTVEAKESIIRLSKLMRHLLYDSEVERIPIQKELEFVKNYVDLMKLRYSDKVKIDLQIPNQVPDKSIPPLLFTSFLENAFKHGVSYQQASYIDISFLYADDLLTFEIVNSNVPLEKAEESYGIGIENSRKRLNLLYGDNYKLEIKDTKDEYHIRLSIPV